MQGIRDRVAIVGMGCTNFGEHWDKSPEDLMIDACYEAFEDAKIETTDIQAAWFASWVSGWSGGRLANALKFQYIPITRVENFCSGGTDAFRNACYAVAAGIYDVVLACGVEKLKDHKGGFPLYIPAPFDSSKVEVDLMPVSHFALFATSYFRRYGLTPEEGKLTLAKIVVKNHHNGSISPKAHLQREVTVEQVLNAPIVSWPLGLFDCCGISDGAAAAIITRVDIAKRFRDDYVLVKGLAQVSGAGQSQLHSDFDFTYFPENVAAAKIAYAEAGIKHPRTEIDIAILHDCFSSTELITYEDLGFSPRGRAREDVDAGTFTLEGELPVNTDGGLKCFGHPISASGLRMIYEVYKQMQGKAGPRQLKKVDIGMIHNLGGVPGCFSVAVAVFGRRD